MTNLKISQVDLGTGARILRASWEMVKANYSAALGFSLLMLLAGMFAQVPTIGFVAQSLMANLALVVFCFVAHQWTQGKSITLSQAFTPLTHDKLMRRLAPLFVISVILAGVWTFTAMANPIVGFITYFAYFFATLCVSLCFPLLIFQPHMNLGEAVDAVIEGVFKNLGPYLWGAVLSSLLMLVCTIALFLPVFFVYIPINIAYNYLWYRSIFEDDPLGRPEPKSF